MSQPKERIQDRLKRRLLSAGGAIPTSSLERLGRTALVAWRTRGLTKASSDDGLGADLDLEGAEQLVASIGQLKGIAMKAAQIISYADVALPQSVQSALSALQTHAQPMPVERVREILMRELGERGDALGSELEAEPVAAASIGQVHRALLPSGEEVAVKVQYPEVEDAIRSDFRSASIGPRVAGLFYPGAQVAGMIDEARARFLEECDYEHEAAAQRRFGKILAGRDDVLVPEVYPDYVSRRVLTTGFVHGRPFDAFLESHPSQERRDRLGRTLFDLYLGPLLQHGVYNCDPHPGNYLLLEGDRVAALDYGCTRTFEPAFVERLRRLSEATYADGRDALHASFVELGMVREGVPYDFATARDLVRAFYGPMLQDAELAIDFGGAIGLRDGFKRKKELLALTIPPEFVFLFRIRFGLMSVLARLGARANWQRLERGYLNRALDLPAAPQAS